MVSVIIPTVTGGFNHLAQLLPQLSKEEDIEIIIVDNDSKDGTTNYLANYDCLLKINKIRRNFSASNNQGASYAKGDYLLFLNNDTVPEIGFTKLMKDTFELDPQIGVVGALLFTMDAPKRVQHAGVMFTKDYVPYELGLAQDSITTGVTASDPRVRAVREVPSVTAACLMVKRSVFDEVGGFDEEYRSGWEDTDFCLKVRELGYKIWYTGKTHVYHKRFGSASAGRFKHEQENRARYDSIWVHTGRAEQVLKGFREG